MIGLEGKTLQSARLTYRLLKEEDKSSLYALLNDASVTVPAGFLPAKSKEAFETFFSDLTKYNTGIALLHHQQLIGYLHVNKYKTNQPEFSGKQCVGVGFVIGRAYQRQGFGTEALTYLTEYLLNRFDACFADHFQENLPSKRTMENSGYTHFEDYAMYFDGIKQEKNCASYVRRAQGVPGESGRAEAGARRG